MPVPLQALLPIPARPHYLFNIRHVSAVFHAMFHAHPASRTTSAQLVRLWQHECCRVFHDRIVDLPQRKWFLTTVHEVQRVQAGPWGLVMCRQDHGVQYMQAGSWGLVLRIQGLGVRLLFGVSGQDYRVLERGFLYW